MGGFRLVTPLAAPVEAAFDLSLDVGLHLRSMEDSQEEILGRSPTGVLALGDEVTWRARHLGRWWQMTNRIVEHQRPARFVDAQVAGPFAAFRHVHLFAPSAGGCVLADELTYTAPYGLVGAVAERVALTRYLRHLFETRNAALAAELAAAADSGG